MKKERERMNQRTRKLISDYNFIYKLQAKVNAVYKEEWYDRYFFQCIVIKEIEQKYQRPNSL